MLIWIIAFIVVCVLIWLVLPTWKRTDDYRIIKKFNSFFSHYYYELQRRDKYKHLWQKQYKSCWSKYAGNELDTEIPEAWYDFHIIEIIKE